MDALARSIASRPLICELWSSLGTELERNIPADAVRAFKLTHTELQIRIAGIVRGFIPALTLPASRELVSLTVLLIAGLWPFANPSPAVAEAEPDAGAARRLS
ncbi:hypothetical protein [Micromonospora sp. 050-3]|uniref:hypothetical protein n=1 Tax=Micromonospora sp. 050-3 TaxID=2789265 RepID=UPI00397D13F7